MPIFVIHEHHARNLHYDLRLEMDGVLKSWAVPKGPPAEPGPRRLAVQVADHDLDYADFEGDIPEGQYGAGKVVIWDAGEFELLERDMDRLVFSLRGRRLSGVYVLVRMKDKGEKNWLLLRKKDGL